MVHRHALFFGIILVALPQLAVAQVANFAFTTDPQTVQLDTISQQISIQAQNAGGTSINIPSTACIALSSSSANGQFSSSANAWNPISTLTMSKNTANKNFYYRASQTGAQTITAKIALKPDAESRSCTLWPQSEWGALWTITQTISVGSTASQTSSGNATSTNATNASSTAKGAPLSIVSSYVPPPVTQIFVDGGPDRTVIVGADSLFSARAYDRKQEIVDRVRFSWNFGDGTTAEGPNVMHHFSYPGTYAVILNIAQDVSAGTDDVIVTAEPANLAFSVESDGSVAIGNRAGRNIDLSRWIVVSFGRSFVLSDHTIVLAGQTLRIASETLGFSVGPQTELQYPNGTRAYMPGPSTVSEGISNNAPVPLSSSVSDSAHPTTTTARPSAKSGRYKHASALHASAHALEDEPADEIIASSSSLVASVEAADTHRSSWWLSAFLIALVAGATAFIAKRMKRTEWNIIEDK